MRITINNINKALKNAGHDVELVRGKGYFYFIGKDAEKLTNDSVAVFNLSALTVDGWVKEFEDKVKMYVK